MRYFFILLFLCSVNVSSAATVVWTNASGGSWSTGSNWSSGSPPQAGDDVVINLNGMYTVEFNGPNISLGSLTVGGTAGEIALELKSSRMTVFGSVHCNDFSLLILSGGTLATNGVSTIENEAVFESGTWEGIGTVDFTTTSTVEVTGPNTFTFNGGTTVNNYGTVNWNEGILRLSQNGTIFICHTNASVNIMGNLMMQRLFGNAHFMNYGVVNRSAGTGVAELSVPLINFGTINNNTAGVLEFDYDESFNYNQIHCTTGGTVSFANGDFRQVTGASLTGDGIFEIDGGKLHIQGATTIPNFVLESGQLHGPGTAEIAGTCLWNGGELRSECTFVIATSANCTISSVSSKILRNGSVVSVFGTCAIDGSTFFMHDNNTQFLVQPGALCSMTNTCSFRLVSGSPEFVCHGDLEISNGSCWFDLNTTFSNTCETTLDNALCEFNRTNTLSGLCTISTSSSIRVFGAQTAIATSASFAGSGPIVCDAGTINFLADSHFVPHLQCTAGTLQGNVVNCANLQLSGGTADNLELVVPSNGVGQKVGASTFIFDDALLRVDGEFVWTDGSITHTRNSSGWHVSTAATVFIDCDENLDRVFGAPQFTNNGTVVKRNGTGTTRIEVRFVNNGQVNILSGEIEFADLGYTGSGNVFVDEHSRLGSSAQNTEFSTNSSVSGDGIAVVRDGRVEIIGVVDIGGASVTNGGVLFVSTVDEDNPNNPADRATIGTLSINDGTVELGRSLSVTVATIAEALMIAANTQSDTPVTIFVDNMQSQSGIGSSIEGVELLLKGGVFEGDINAVDGIIKLENGGILDLSQIQISGDNSSLFVLEDGTIQSSSGGADIDIKFEVGTTGTVFLQDGDSFNFTQDSDNFGTATCSTNAAVPPQFRFSSGNHTFHPPSTIENGIVLRVDGDGSVTFEDPQGLQTGEIIQPDGIFVAENGSMDVQNRSVSTGTITVEDNGVATFHQDVQSGQLQATGGMVEVNPNATNTLGNVVIDDATLQAYAQYGGYIGNEPPIETDEFLFQSGNVTVPAIESSTFTVADSPSGANPAVLGSGVTATETFIINKEDAEFRIQSNDGVDLYVFGENGEVTTSVLGSEGEPCNPCTFEMGVAETGTLQFVGSTDDTQSPPQKRNVKVDGLIRAQGTTEFVGSPALQIGYVITSTAGPTPEITGISSAVTNARSGPQDLSVFVFEPQAISAGALPTTTSSLTAPLRFNSDVLLGTSATFNCELSGRQFAFTDSTQYDQLLFTSSATLGGTINVSLLGSFEPQEGDEFHIVSWADYSGEFDVISVPNLPGDMQFIPQYRATTLTLVATSGATTTIAYAASGFYNGLDHTVTAVLVETRTGASLQTSTLVERTTALVSSSGTITAELSPANNVWLVVRHGGHFPIASSTLVNISAGSTFDFTLPANVFNGAQALIEESGNGTSWHAVKAGDLNSDQAVNATDFLMYFLPNYGVVNPGSVPE